MTEEVSLLKNEVEILKGKNKRLKQALTMETQANEEKLEEVKLKYFCERDELVEIINILKTKLNELNKGVDCELDIQNQIIDRQ